MKNKRTRKNGPVTLAVAAALLLLGVACSDMSEQPSFKAQEGPRRTPPPEAVPIGGVERALPGRLEPAGVADNADARSRGAELFAVNCAFCHGTGGRGDGPVGRRLDPAPPDLYSAAVRRLSGEEIFLRLTWGWGRMPAFRNRLSADDRWRIVFHVRSQD